jgi:hypothetical protein
VGTNLVCFEPGICCCLPADQEGLVEGPGAQDEVKAEKGGSHQAEIRFSRPVVWRQSFCHIEAYNVRDRDSDFEFVV